MTTVGVAVGMLTDVPKLLPVLEGLGAKHKGYGVLPAHYDVVGQALLDTLALGLGEAFTPSLKAAWAEVYGIVSSTMIKGAAYDDWGKYAAPKTDEAAAATKQSQASALDWYTSADAATRPN